MDFTREIQRSVDEGILTLRGRQAGRKRCVEKTLAVGTPAAGGSLLKTLTVSHPGTTLTNARLRCVGVACAYGSRANERRPAPGGAIARAHLDSTGRGPHDWYLATRPGGGGGGGGGNSTTEFTVGRYDSMPRLGWTTPLEIVYDQCFPDWTADLNVSTKSFPVVGDEKVEKLLSEAVFLGFGVSSRDFAAGIRQT